MVFSKYSDFLLSCPLGDAVLSLLVRGITVTVAGWYCMKRILLVASEGSESDSLADRCQQAANNVKC